MRSILFNSQHHLLRASAAILISYCVFFFAGYYYYSLRNERAREEDATFTPDYSENEQGVDVASLVDMKAMKSTAATVTAVTAASPAGSSKKTVTPAAGTAAPLSRTASDTDDGGDIEMAIGAGGGGGGSGVGANSRYEVIAAEAE